MTPHILPSMGPDIAIQGFVAARERLTIMTARQQLYAECAFRQRQSIPEQPSIPLHGGPQPLRRRARIEQRFGKSSAVARIQPHPFHLVDGAQRGLVGARYEEIGQRLSLERSSALEQRLLFAADSGFQTCSLARRLLCHGQGLYGNSPHKTSRITTGRTKASRSAPPR